MTNDNDKPVPIQFTLPKSWNDRFTDLLKKQGKIKKATIENLVIDFIEKEEEKMKKGTK